MASYGPADNAKWLGSNRACSVSAYDSSVSLNAKFKYMFQKLTDKAHSMCIFSLFDFLSGFVKVLEVLESTAFSRP